MLDNLEQIISENHYSTALMALVFIGIGIYFAIKVKSNYDKNLPYVAKMKNREKNSNDITMAIVLSLFGILVFSLTLLGPTPKETMADYKKYYQIADSNMKEIRVNYQKTIYIIQNRQYINSINDCINFAKPYSDNISLSFRELDMEIYLKDKSIFKYYVTWHRHPGVIISAVDDKLFSLKSDALGKTLLTIIDNIERDYHKKQASAH